MTSVRVSAHCSLCWNELQARDLDAAALPNPQGATFAVIKLSM